MFVLLRMKLMKFFFKFYRKSVGASTISSALNAHAANLNGNVSFPTYSNFKEKLIQCDIQ
jgi:hypothetical protein